ncbi:helix-turn-helix domain-containing protein [Streptomyces sp. DSM 44915]|uniref:Helix-turn-helix domain-containing protein n=1 Tax=Streptomyces chisholmiae TaxID=3075540 RepID=A0ABU2K0H3_9ACTN|nr:helix-turn-helix domain-containing protein [Streptomyces sp. DSM 44915]MDT0270501.1 helix-turn-helix domain-containing protein [Streptomyces sp. DSM 44915]
MRDGELGAFIRARREAVRPDEVGLPAGARRRTPGLRRAELAMLADVSVEYLTRLEQGRDTRPSGTVLAALSAALRLSGADVLHLQQLASINAGPELCRFTHAGDAGGRATEQRVRPQVRALLGQFEPHAGCVLSHRSDVLAWTEGYARLMGPLGLWESTPPGSPPGSPPNLAWFTFVGSGARLGFPDWAGLADEQVATLHELRWGDGGVDALADRLAAEAGPEFAERWARRPLGAPRSGTRTVHHPEVGDLRLDFEVMQLADEDQRLLLMLAADPASAAAWQRLPATSAGATAAGAQAAGAQAARAGGGGRAERGGHAAEAGRRAGDERGGRAEQPGPEAEAR